MGIFEVELWKCSCGFEFIAQDGLYEADPNDFGTTHVISGYHCEKCGEVKNVACNCSLERPQEENKHLCVNESDVCDNCGSKMKIMSPPKIKFLQKGLLCPKCKKHNLKYIKVLDEVWT